MGFEHTLKHFDRCCNPFNLPNHLKKTNLRYVNEGVLAKCSWLKSDERICDLCQKKVNLSTNPLPCPFQVVDSGKDT